MERQKILIADDEERIVKLISDFLGAAGYTAVSAYDGAEALEVFDANPDIALAVIDIMMPVKDGWELTRDIRSVSDIPIIMLSARAEDFDMLTGFDAGIDEYVTKPFSPAVLVKRISALLKRAETSENVEHSSTAGLYIDTLGYNAYIDGQVLELTLKEFELIKYLTDNDGIVLTRDRILDAVWGFDYIGDTRTVDSHIAKLRTKLGEFGTAHLKTVYGMGYKFER